MKILVKYPDIELDVKKLLQICEKAKLYVHVCLFVEHHFTNLSILI
jgi:hypothetical protein